MRIKKISRDEVMVYLTMQDLEYFDFNPGEKIPQQADLHRLLFEVMELVQTETGFDPYHGGQVVVEASASAVGMNLSISKVKTGRKHRITREEFKKAKTVRVKQGMGFGSDDFSNDEIRELIDRLGIGDAIKEKMKSKKNEIFIFDEFTSLEGALSLLPDEVTKKCALYRNGSRYALLTALIKGSRYSNMLSEFARSSCTYEIVERDIREGWSPVAEKEALVDMAGAMRDMQ
ncbi:MAG: adaptor protein MecA [Candidatus Ornithomonoglobus sp.]